MSFSSFSTGFAASAALVAAIGAQNAYVLRLGLRGVHVLPVILVCIASDVLLIGAGVAGMGSVVASSPGVLAFARWGGAAFLAAYGVLALSRATRPGGALGASAEAPVSAARAVLTTLGFTFLNPHVYLDTVLLLGTLGATQPEGGHVAYVAGATTASACWFVALGYGARRLAPVFATPRAWRFLDAGVGALMLVLAAGLARARLG